VLVIVAAGLLLSVKLASSTALRGVAAR
jgi:hypothetical protein